MSMNFVLGIDIGSSAVKAVVLDGRSGSIVHVSRIDYPSVSPRIGYIEMEPRELEQAVYRAVSRIPDAYKTGLQGIAVTGQMCGITCLDEDEQPIGRIISIFDTRAVAEAEMLEQRYATHLARHQANHALPIYTLPKVLWLRAHEPVRFQRTRRVLLPKDYIRGLLTGRWCSEPSDASGTLVYDQFAHTWDQDLLRDLRLPLSLWPEIIPSDAQAGTIMPSAAVATGLPVGLPVFAGAADMAAVLVGAGAPTADSLVISLGTAAHVLAPVDALASDAWPVQQYAQALTNSWFRFGAVFSGGASLEWFLKNGSSNADYSCFDTPSWENPEQRVLFTPYLAGAGAPHYVPEAGGAFLGLKVGHSSRDLAQAVLEGVALEVNEVYRSLDSQQARRIHVTGGASRIPAFVSILANVLQREVHISSFPDATALGAALLAWKGVSGQQENTFPDLKLESGVVQPCEQGMQFYRSLAPRYLAAASMIRQLG